MYNSEAFSKREITEEVAELFCAIFLMSPEMW